ncbi:threonine/homoserine exporter RhtA [Mesorhizobium retamae]|uniref:Threonine/homoserine exporter RhtA n=1 Tax=Mesorhizobium retamae TaxID=2912854 RepID=A0ABS9Q7T3_9HYPH|nr:threonine/homoserine exporter RhtA [Mesorhizobium sp. IRAMC:0171]MCG7503480.1 threonine/homoserine exporter RhtA [Mesorhizobium sp. IRAMC:0171]
MTTAIRQAETPATLLIPIAALIVAMLSFTSGASVAKQLFPIIGAQGTTALRLSIGALILVAVLRPWRVRLSATSWQSIVFYGLAMGGMNLLFYMSIHTLPLGIAIALEFTGPLTVAILSSRRKIDLLWVALAAGGLLLLLPFGDSIANVDPLGAMFALGAGGCWALYIIAGKRAGQEHGALAASLGMVVAAIAVAPIGFAHAGMALFQPDVLLIGVVVAILSSAFPYTLEMFALRHLPAQTYGTLTSGEPAAGAMVGLLLLGEALPLLQWCAIAMIVAASVGATMTAMRNRSAPEPLNLA